MRLAHIADLHVDEKRDLVETRRILKAFIEASDAEGVDARIIAGDVFERLSTPAERALVAWFLEELSRLPLIVVKGNHDADLDLSVYAPYSNIYLSQATNFAAGPEIIRTQSGDLHVFTLPWFDKSHLAAMLPADVPKGELTERMNALVETMMRNARYAVLESADDDPTIMVGHILVAGSEMSTGQTLIGQTVEISPQSLLDLGAHYVALGHIHKYQTWFGGRVTYSGSPERMNFGEPEEKGWVLVHIGHDGASGSSRFMPLPSREIMLLEFDLTEGQVEFENMMQDLRNDAYDDANVRVRVHVEPHRVGVLDDKAVIEAVLACGANRCVVEPIMEHVERVRAVEVSQAESVFDKLVAYFAATGIIPNEDDIRTRLREIE